MPLGMIAQRHRADNHPDLAFPAAEEASHQRGRGAAGGGIVDADIVRPSGGGCVRYQRDDMNTARDEVVDRCPDPGMIERDGRNAMIAWRKPFKRRSERSRIEHIDMHYVDIAVLACQPIGRALDLHRQVGHSAASVRYQLYRQTEALAA